MQLIWAARINHAAFVFLRVFAASGFSVVLVTSVGVIHPQRTRVTDRIEQVVFLPKIGTVWCLQVSVTASLHLFVSDGTSDVNFRVVNLLLVQESWGEQEAVEARHRTERCLVDRHSETPGDLFGFISRHFDFPPHISVVYF